jgi:UDP-N-acetylglucosamine 1-carboxyvinyltransferase
MEKFIIEGGHPLSGELVPSGNKNAALPILAATLLTDEPIILKNVPIILDVIAMKNLIESLGVSITEIEPNTWEVHAKEISFKNLDPDLCRRIRA